MINANEARGMMKFDKAMNYIEKNIRETALAGNREYTYTTDFFEKGKKIAADLVAVGYVANCTRYYGGKRAYKVVVRW